MTLDWELIHFFWKYTARSLCIIICVWAFLQGGVTERAGALITIVAWYISFIHATHDGSGPAITTVVVDIVAMLCFAVLAIWSRRPWTFFITACMVNAVVTHFIARTLGLGTFAYVTVSGFWGGYGILACLAAGIMGHRALVRQGG
ncbi:MULTISPECIES: hypothetical protein [Asticcacaulis]|uniref:hypothetical protein n=1 Tax=Asticcacaulis TaxID=76890 RepID=UPI001AE31933|nr:MULTISPECIES: hypothetical protein [Asticcacaulis]MBP2159473.1 hypothetical protein [Asticcacaulis solisilvae]MDR6800700.1 hypothetical protein [Asticcacaulis sp. BE141]